MTRKLIVGLFIFGLCVALNATTAFADGDEMRVSAVEKGSVLIFPKVEVRWNAEGTRLIQDTFLDVANDLNEDVEVIIFWVNGDPYLPEDGDEREHLGHSCPTPLNCIFRDSVQTTIGGESPIYWSAAKGGHGVSSITNLDPGWLPGRPSNDGTNTRVMRGYVIVIAVNEDGEPIKHNHLKGDATLVYYATGMAWEYNAYAYQVVEDIVTGEVPTDAVDNGTGIVNFDGVAYDANFKTLLMDFYKVGSCAFSKGVFGQEYFYPVQIFTDLTLLTADIDLRQDYEKMTRTKAEFEILDENGDAHLNMWRCITLWDQTFLQYYRDFDNDFISLPTEKGFARIEGVESDQRCNVDLDGDGIDDLDSEDAPLLGVVMKLLVFNYGEEYANAGTNLHGRGVLPLGQIIYDLESGGEPPSAPKQLTPTAASSVTGVQLIRR
jgi:hypothetical protein